MRGMIDPDPLMNCRFVVEDDANGVVAAFSEFSGIKMSVQTLTNRFGEDNAYPEYIPVMTAYEPITLSRGVIGDTSFLDWLLDSTGGLNGNDHFSQEKKDLLLVALDEKGKRMMAWQLCGAIPVGYELSPMDATNSQILTESVTVQVTKVKRINESGYREQERRWGQQG